MKRFTEDDRNALQRAVDAGFQPRPSGGSKGLIVSIPREGKKNSFKTLINSQGIPTPAGLHYFSLLNQDPPDRRFDSQQAPVRARYGRREEITLKDGSTAVVRTWNNRNKTWRLTKIGQEFYSHRPITWSVQVPVIEYLPRKNGSYYQKEGWVPSSAIPELSDLTFYGHLDEKDQRAEVLARVNSWLTSKKDRFEGKTIINEAAYDIQTLDTNREIEYSKEETFLEDGQAQVAAVLNRPLRAHDPLLWGDMYKADSLAAEAFQGEGNCVVRQLDALAFDGKNPAWSRSALLNELDRARHILYSGENDPYVDDDGTRLDWRDVGVTAAMLSEVCKQRGLPLHILWHNHVIERVHHDNQNHKVSRLAVHIRGDHAYFYKDPYAKRVIARDLPLSIPQRTPEAKLRVRKRGEGTFEDWDPLTTVEPGMEGHYYVVGDCQMLEVRKKMHELGLCPKVSLSGPCVQDVSRLTLRARGKKEDFVVHRVHPEYRACLDFIKHFQASSMTDEPFPYRGESPGSVLAHAFEVLSSIGHTRNVSQLLRESVFGEQQGMCADCGDRMSRFEIDHRTPLSLGGSNLRENLAAVCHECHRAKTLSESQAQIADATPLLSRLNRETYELFHMSRKPPQLVANISEPVPGKKTMQIDVVRCRYSQFLENIHDLPIFCAVDDIQPATRGVLGDYMYLHRTRNLSSPRDILPYWGPGWYWRAETEWMLDVGIIDWEDILYVFSASAHVKPSFLADRLRRLDSLWEESQDEEFGVPSKHALNSMFGIWAIQQTYSYRLYTADDPRDVVEGSTKKSPTPGCRMVDGEYEMHDYVVRTELKDYASMRPIHQICLSQERLIMAKMCYLLERLSIPHELVSIRNDGASIQPGKAWEQAKDIFENVTYGSLTRLQRLEQLRRSLYLRQERLSDSETRVFRVKDTKSVPGMEGTYEIPLEPDLPGGELRISDDPPLELPFLSWDVIRETDGEDFYQQQIFPHAIEDNKSFLLSGPAGTGKSYILQRLEKDLKEKGESVAKITLTHVACRRLGDAQTAHHFAIRHVLNGSFRGWLLIDEIGMIPTVLLTVLENLSVLGVKFAMFGDWNQLSAPMDNWRGTSISPGTFRRSRLLHLWAEGTEFQLTQCRRSTTEHFDLCLSVLDGDLAAAVEHVKLEFPPRRFVLDHEQGDFHLVLSHRRRMALNDACQRAAHARYCEERPGAPVLLISESEIDLKKLNMQQTFMLFPGTHLIACNSDVKGIVNGAFLKVTGVSEEGCTVDDDEGGSHELTADQVSRSTRLAWAITITSSQSREFSGRVAIWDADSPYFTRAHLYTALTRVKIGEAGCSLVVM